MNKNFLVAITVVVLLLAACEQKKEQPEIFNSLYLLYATPEKDGYLPLKIFSENDSLFVQYIKNDKPLERMRLKYKKSTEKDYGTFYYFDEIIEGNSNGTYIIEGNFECDGYVSNGSSVLYYINKAKDTITYYFDCPIFKEDIIIDINDLHESEKTLLKMKDSQTNRREDEIMYAKNFRYLILSNPKTLEYPFRKLQNTDYRNIITSKDGNLRIYYLKGLWDEIIQYRDNIEVKTNDFIEHSSTLRYCDNVFTYNTYIKDIFLNNRKYYLIEFALLSGRYNSIDCVTQGNEIAIYAIEDGHLVKKELFNTGKKIIDEILVEFEGDRNEEYHLFKYDENKKIIYVPLVDGVKLTNKYLFYQWDGEYFIYKGIENLKQKNRPP